LRNTIGLTLLSSLILCGFVGDVRIKTPSSGLSGKVVSAGIGFQSDAVIPTMIPNLVVWFDAADTSTIADTTGAVTQWNDKSGNGNNIVQATALDQPVTNATTQNGLNVMDFEDDEHVEAIVDTISQPLTIFTVVKFTDKASGVGETFVDSSVSTDDRLFVRKANDNDIDVSAGIIVTGNAALSGFNIYAVLANTTASSLFVNGASQFVGQDIGANDFELITIGANASASAGLTGSVAETIIYSRLLTEGERISITKYLSSKWAIGI